MGVLIKTDGQLHPTLAGLLVAGNAPQQYFPGLMLTFTVFSGTSKAADTVRIISKKIIGTIPDILIDTTALVQQYMSTGAVIRNGLRKDIPEYPLIAVREAVANALVHRDYSAEGRSTHIQVNMYADRLEITNPGGIYGSVDTDTLGKKEQSSVRNEFLWRILSYTPFSGYSAEDKGTGFMTILNALVESSSPSPKTDSSPGIFSISFEKRKNNLQKIDFRKHPEDAILDELDSSDSLSISELIDLSGLSRTAVCNHIKKLVRSGKIEPIEPPRSPKQRYRLVRQ